MSFSHKYAFVKACALSIYMKTLNCYIELHVEYKKTKYAWKDLK